MSNILSRPQAVNAEELSLEDGIVDIEGSGFEEDFEDEKGDFAPEPRLRRPTHPGAILRDLYLPRTGVTLTDLADRLDVSRRSVSMIVNGSRPITVDMAHRLARALGTSAQLWLNLQLALDVWDASHTHREEYERIQPLLRAA